MEYALLSPLYFFLETSYRCSQCGLRKDVKFGSYEQRLETPQDLRGGAAGSQAWEAEALAPAAHPPSLGLSPSRAPSRLKDEGPLGRPAPQFPCFLLF